MRDLKVIAIVAAYNEERSIAGCLEHFIQQGISVYLCDNGSTEQTIAIAERYLGAGLIGIETIPRKEVFSWKPILVRKEQLALDLDADWFIHADPDEIRLPPRSGQTLRTALAEADAEGYNAVNFLEFTFVPTRESPDHDHPNYLKTMRWYYPFLPSFPHRLNAWKKQSSRVELAWSGGHRVRFPDLLMYPQSFPMRHYLFLSGEHARRKYARRRYDPAEVEQGWHGWRSDLQSEMMSLPRQAELRLYIDDDRLDPSHPRQQHYLEEAWRVRRSR